ncbi:MAG: hypothetical protein CSA72_08410 [Rhodobacterales bacterium]|nr:MAG: hypothetical protein CSA72_08410 [Rhodobacterales bacterium]
MAKASFFRGVELDVIRVGVARGRTYQEIADYLGRSRNGVFQQKRKMEEAGTLSDLPFEFLADRLDEDMQK